MQMDRERKGESEEMPTGKHVAAWMSFRANL